MSRAPRARTPLGKRITQAFLDAVGEDPAAEAAQTFIAFAAGDAEPEEPPELTPEQLALNLADFWAFGARRPDRKPRLRILPVLGAEARLDRLEILQDDAPFLVDSVMGEIAEQGLAVRAMYHPVVGVARDRRGTRVATGTMRRESAIQVILEHLGPDREAALITGVRETLADALTATQDFQAMLGLMGTTIAELRVTALPPAERDEAVAFLTWLQDGHFVFLGARNYDYPKPRGGKISPAAELYKPGDGLGVLRDPDRSVLRRANEPAVLGARMQGRLRSEPALTVAKSNLRSRVHRRTHMDYVGVKRYAPDGTPVGEVRFVGLFSSEVYDQPAASVPLLRAKLAHVIDKAALAPGGHNEKRLRNVLENHPRDELFQISESELLTQALGILHLFDRPRVRLFERRDPFDRFASILFYAPRDRFNSDLQAQVGAMLAEAYGGRVSAAYPAFGEGALARVHFIIGFTPQAHLNPSLATLEAAASEAARTWEDRFEAVVRADVGEPAAIGSKIACYRDAFRAGYKDRYDAAEALADIAEIEALPVGETIRARAFRLPDDPPTRFRFKLYRPGAPALLADVLPIVENMGLKALAEQGFPVRPAGAEPVWVHDFEIEDERGEHLVFADLKLAFEDAITAVWSGRAENDGFNRLVLELSISWREAALIRAIARHRQQSGLDPSQRVQEQALNDYPGVARLILDLFRSRFDPAVKANLEQRQAQAQAIMGEITEALQLVESLDHDRALRRMALLTAAIKRTNYYQRDAAGQPKPYISFKVASPEVADLPAPKPYREIFVSAAEVEGVHLRFGPVARGGLRWSDRRDDFRTEVLGLVKAQQVKNAVIVPVGSKGGFYPKMLPKSGPDAIRAEGIRAYRTFLSGLLDITDNLGPDGKVIRPEGVIAHDGDDPYLVVAADKGTATFSDIANGVARDYGFWLDDAFASGGSAGYDHKVMAITARGAWEAVKRHFRELGKDIQAESFTVAGVGDMSGDVFGNGMLLSRQIRLVAAFDHRHVFLDPDPDPAASFVERQRMFALPRSSWDDYDRKLISKGGGVFPRTLKSIPLSPEVRALLDVDAEAMAPTELINAILKMRAELLYLGGIGTYVKSSAESHADAGDKASDAVRVNGADLRVQVVGEGANLGLTQRGRIEFAQAGGRIDTDAIDNSAGVDCSDHEVNIKIVTGALERQGKLTRKRRDALLKSMTDEVAQHVLAHNYGQTLALSLLEMDSSGDLDAHARFMARLEAAGRLDRAVEFLPDIAEITARRAAGRGLTRPELAVLLAYGKLELSEAIVESAAPDDDYFDGVLEAYFPKALRKHREAIAGHRLRREIIATVVANDLINRCGPSFPSRLQAAADCDAGALAIGYEAAKAVLDLDRIWAAVEALDGRIPAPAQMALFRRLADAARGATFWLARRAARETLTVARLRERYGPAYRVLRELSPGVLSAVDRMVVDDHCADLVAAGAPEDLARATAVLQTLTTAGDLVDLAGGSAWPLAEAARLDHRAGEAFGFDRLRAAAGGYTAGDHFERTAVRRLVEDLLIAQTAVTRQLMSFAGKSQAAESDEAADGAIASWSAMRGDAVATAKRTLEEIEGSPGGWTFAKLTIANAALRELASAGAGAQSAGGKRAARG